MEIPSVWIKLYFIALSSNYIRTVLIRDVAANASPPADLGDSADYNPWEPCDPKELCLSKRTHKCTNSSSPHISCGSLVWKEALMGCYVCSQNLWRDDGGWSKCVGEGCAGTVQSFSYTCANIAVNPNCKLIQTRYCNGKDICDGKWASWTTNSAECQAQCGKAVRTRVLERTCMKNGKPSSSCASPNQSPPLEDVYIDRCTAEPCQTSTAPPQTTSTDSSTTTTASTTTTTATTTTTTASTTTTTASTTTTTASTTTTIASTTTTAISFALSQWSTWTVCSATCENRQGFEARKRKCVDQDGNEVSSTACEKDTMIEKQSCQVQNVEKCKTKETSATDQIPLTTTKPTNKANSNKKSISGARKVEIPRPEVTTAANISAKATSIIPQLPSSLKKEHKILIIVLVITGCLIAIVVIIYAYMLKRKKERERKSKIRSISLVGLQSHTGFMDGMERYGFTKTMVPTGEIFSAMNPKATNDSTVTPVRMEDIQQRELPQKPLKTSPEHMLSNQTHIYEDMRLSADELRVATQDTPPMRRSHSYHERINRYRAYTLGMHDIQARRQSLGLTVRSQRRKSLAPPKPPRKSMINTENERSDGSEIKEVPKYLYSSRDKMQLPDLGFINSIHPPLYSPPATSPGEIKNSLTLPNLATHARSAPASPNHKLYGTAIPHSPYLAPVFLPYNGMQFMAPVQSQNGGVVYMPFSPIYPSSPSFQMTQSPQRTPLHGTDVLLRRHSTKPERPKTMSFVPEISISEVDSHLLSPNNSVKSPLLGDYTEMRYLGRPSIPPDFEDADSMSTRSKSFGHLHGTQNNGSDANDENTNKETVSKSPIPEDSEGYLVPTKV